MTPSGIAHDALRFLRVLWYGSKFTVRLRHLVIRFRNAIDPILALYRELTVRRALRLVLSGISLLCLSPALCGQNASTRRIEGVQATAPVVISFNRIAPLLDGLFEDVTAIQLSPLQLSATGANAATLDAFQRSFQGAFSANTLDALQNQVNSQLFQTQASFQTSMLGQLTTFTQQLADANNSLSQATAAQTAAAAAAAASPDDTNLANASKAASTVLTNAQAAQTSIQAEVTALQKAIASPPTIGTVSSTTPSGTTNAAGGAQSTLTRFLGTTGASANPALPTFPSTPSSTNGTASLPPTQQMDTQIGLLWDRVMRVASTFGEPDSEKNVRYELLRFYPSVTYSDKKTEAIKLTYKASCENAPGGAELSLGNNGPRIIDLYPRRSPVNILGEKVKDNSFSLAGFLGFGAANASASYNQEHLKMTSAMSQSSYVTGFGAGMSEFGWLLGKVLGDDTIAAGQREMYALIAIPIAGCSTLKVQAIDVAWLKANGTYLNQVKNPSDGPPLEFGNESIEQVASISSITYAQSPLGSLVPISIELDQPVDPEMRIVVNGGVMVHSLDNFARGTATASGSTPNNTGIFEQQPGSSNSIQAGTWSAISEKRLVLVLDPKSYPNQLPSISMILPTSRRIDLSYSEKVLVSLNGYSYKCPVPCALGLPGLALPPGTGQVGVATHFQSDSSASLNDKILIRIPSDVSALAISGTSRILSAGDPSVQPWGPSPRVLAITANGIRDLEPCSADGLLLICSAWGDYQGEEATLDIYDAAHSGGSLHTQIKLGHASGRDKTPQLLSTPSPSFDGQVWTFQFPIMARTGDGVEMRAVGGNKVFANLKPNEKPDGYWAGSSPVITSCQTNYKCIFSFAIQKQYLNRLQDNLEIFFFPYGNLAKGDLGDYGTTHLHLLRSSLLPSLDQVDATNQHLHGANLVFDKLQFGNGGPTTKLECADPAGGDCLIPTLPTVKSVSYVYLVQDNGPDGKPVHYPLPLTSGATASFWTYVTPAKKVSVVAQPTKAKVPAQPAKTGAPAAPAVDKGPTIKIYMYEAKPNN